MKPVVIAMPGNERRAVGIETVVEGQHSTARTMIALAPAIAACVRESLP